MQLLFVLTKPKWCSFLQLSAFLGARFNAPEDRSFPHNKQRPTENKQQETARTKTQATIFLSSNTHTASVLHGSVCIFSSNSSAFNASNR